MISMGNLLFESGHANNAIKYFEQALNYNPKDPHILIGGMYNGLLAYWDDRKGSAQGTGPRGDEGTSGRCECGAGLTYGTWGSGASAGRGGRGGGRGAYASAAHSVGSQFRDQFQNQF